VLALDECVNEEFLKLYVAYKSETNFVDVVPQAKRLVLALNMSFPEINYPKGRCKDVTGQGRTEEQTSELQLREKLVCRLPRLLRLTLPPSPTLLPSAPLFPSPFWP